MLDRNELWAQAEELADLIISSPEVVNYQRAEAALQATSGATTLLSQVREMRERVAEFQSRGVPLEHYKGMLQQLDKLAGKLDSIPEVVHLRAAESAMNALLESISSQLARAVRERIVSGSRQSPTGSGNG